MSLQFSGDAAEARENQIQPSPIVVKKIGRDLRGRVVPSMNMYTTQTNGLGADIGTGTINPAALNSTCKRFNLPASAFYIPIYLEIRGLARILFCRLQT